MADPDPAAIEKEIRSKVPFAKKGGGYIYHSDHSVPDNVSFEAGAGLLFNDLTVYFALTVRGRLARGETVLVHGAAGGIGTSTLRLAPALGASRVIAVVSTEEKKDVARAAGATDVVLADGFKDAVAELTGGKGVDIVMDPVGGDRFTDSLDDRPCRVEHLGRDLPTGKPCAP
jgi:NADPH:quinone reductase-like Zn-dependent oxidoreductase